MFQYGKDGFYNAGSNYGYKASPGPWGKAKNYLSTYPGGSDAELNPQDYFTHKISSAGFGGTNNASNNVHSMYGRLHDAYGAARLKNNALTWKKFLDPIDFNSVLAGMSNQEKGIQSSNVAPGNVRWVPR